MVYSAHGNDVCGEQCFASLNRLTAPVAGEEHSGEHAKGTLQTKSRSIADDAKATGNEGAEEAKTTYGKIVNSIGNLFGGKKTDDAPG